MTPEIKERIDQIRNGIVPEGYKRIKDALVPAEWSTYKISDFATINQGFTFSRDFQGNSNDEWNYFKVADIGLNLNSRYLTKALNTISEDTMHQIGCVPFKAGSIVFPRVGAALLNNNKKILAQDSIVDDNVLVLSVTDANICVNEFIYYALQNMRLESWCNSGLVPVISAKIVYKYILYLPPIREQQKISEILSAQDKVIELEQQEIVEIMKVKRFFLEKMFPKKGQTVPEIRFKGFTDAWEQRKFEDIAARSSTISSESGLPRVEYEDIIAGTGRLNKDIFAKESNKTGIVFYRGDVLYGKLRPYLQNWLLPSFNGLAVGDFWVLQPQNADSSFLYRLIQSRQFDEVSNQSTGTKMPRADWKLISKTEFFIPNTIDEQAVIGTFFEQLDNLITLHQRKLEEEKKKKKALMQLLLTGIVRV